MFICLFWVSLPEAATLLRIARRENLHLEVAVLQSSPSAHCYWQSIGDIVEVELRITFAELESQNYDVADLSRSFALTQGADLSV